jgi:hypothetical protein
MKICRRRLLLAPFALGVSFFVLPANRAPLWPGARHSETDRAGATVRRRGERTSFPDALKAAARRL